MSRHLLSQFYQLLIHPLFDTVFPPLCYICYQPLSRDRKIICESCWGCIPKFDGILDPSLKSRRLNNLLILFEFDDIVRLMIHLFKYKNHLTLADYFALEAKERYSEMLRNAYQAIIPVPLHQTRRRERGYNQSEQICMALSKLIHVPVRSDYLVRIHPTKSQTRMSREDRDKNVKNAFYSPSGMQENRILLVDDVITTGSTIEACSNSLKRAGVKEVDILAVAHPVELFL